MIRVICLLSLLAVGCCKSDVRRVYMRFPNGVVDVVYIQVIGGQQYYCYGPGTSYVPMTKNHVILQEYP